jgi:ribonuclease P protein component
MINPATNRETFSKSEKLCSKKEIEALFENGKSFYCFPFLIVWSYSKSDLPSPAQAAFSVSKKGFKLAVTRNLIKRRTREAYRKNKSRLYDFLISSDRLVVFTLIYRGKIVSDYAIIEKSVKEVINKFITILGETPPKS